MILAMSRPLICRLRSYWMALPYAQTYFPLKSSTNSILPTCTLNVSTSPEPILTISSVPCLPQKDLSNDVQFVSGLEGVAKKKHVNKEPASAVSHLPE